MKTSFFLIFSILTLASLSNAQSIDVNNPPSGTVRVVNPAASVYSSPIVRNIGDFNGDGLIDFSLAYPLDDIVYVVYGKRNYAPTIDLSALGPNGFVVQGVSGTNFGSALVSPGDVDRDGKADLAIGAPLEGNGGRVYLLKGSYNLQTISATNDSQFALIVEGAPGENLGQYLGKGGSIDGDASADMLIPSPSFVTIDEGDNTILGAAYVIFGQFTFPERVVRTTTLDPESTLTLLNAPQQDGEFGFGRGLQAIGNFTGSNANDLALIASIGSSVPHASIRILPGPLSLRGVYSITDLPFESLDVTVRLFDTSAMHQIYSISSCDVTGDGRTEMILGFPDATLSTEMASGGVTVVVANPTQQTGEIAITPDDLSAVSLITISESKAAFGAEIVCSSWGLRVGTPFASSPNGDVQNQGALFTFDKSALEFGASRSTEEIASLRFYGRDSNDLFAASFASLGDLNKDGWEELLIGTSEIGDNPTAAYIISANASATGIGNFWLY